MVGARVFDFKDLHVGLTSRCRLQCLECTRNDPDATYMTKNGDMDIDHFIRFLLACAPRRILFCGNWGDPIYARGFLELLRRLREELPEVEIMIHTNGFGRSPKWWSLLMQTLGDYGKLIFSIDGVPDNYTKYRVNSRWSSVEAGIKACVGYKNEHKLKTSIEWKYLVFSYNEHCIQEAYELSSLLGFDRFYLQRSIVNNTIYGRHRWLSITRPFSEIEREFNAANQN
jgi:MoaA/NifB/PqqE/SkfB family radical SAM enzyme